MFSLLFMVLISAENAIVKRVRDDGFEAVANHVDRIVLIISGGLWFLLNLAVFIVYLKPNIPRKGFSQIDVSY
jgi:hypothetical protein